MTRKVMEEIDKFETKINNIKEIIIDAIEHECGELISDLNYKKRLIIEEIKYIEIKTKN